MDGNLSDRERHRIERNLMKDPFEEEAAEGLSQISSEEVREDLAMLDQQIQKRVSGKRTFIWYRVAAIIAVLLATSLVFVMIFDDRIGQLDRKVAETAKKSEDKKMEESRSQEGILPAREAEPEIPESIHLAVKPDNKSGSATAIEERAKEEIPETVQIAGMETADTLIEETSDEILPETGTREVMALETGEAEITAEAVTREVPSDIPAQPMATSKSRKMALSAVELDPGAGQRMVSGIVVSGDDDQPLPGVSIMVKGTTTGVVSDKEGNFSIPVNEMGYNTLVANFIGMESEEVSITDQSEMEIVLQPDQASLDDLVIVDYEANKTYEPEGFKEHIESNIRFPEESELNRAIVILNFTVGLDGRPNDITVLISPAESFSREAIRLLNEGPDWKPADRDDESHEQSTRIRIVFNKEGS